MRLASCRTAATLFISLLCAVGCASSGDDALGAITVELVGQAPSGNVYRLRDAIITVQGPSSITIWNTEAAPDQMSLSADVVVGEYTASIEDGWRLERLDGSEARTVAAQLASDNPVQFTVAALQRTTVPLQFRVNAEVVDMSQGYDIVVTVEESPPLLAVANSFPDISGVTTSVEVFAASANGNVSPVRTISGPSSGVIAPFAIAVADNQLIVCDELTSSINFYPISANGNVGPSRQISGFSTGLSTPLGIAVSEGELYVVQAGGPILVFPLTASGDVSPSRTLFAIGAAKAIAIDRGELFVISDSSSIAVYPTTAIGIPSPARIIFPENAPCLSGITARGGELFVTDSCFGGVRVLPEAASGFTPALRAIAGPRTGLEIAGDIARFGDEIFVTDSFTRSIRVFPAHADGDVFPTRVITGARANLSFPRGVAVF